MKWRVVVWYFMANGKMHLTPVTFVSDEQTCVKEAARLNTTQDSGHIVCTYFTLGE